VGTGGRAAMSAGAKSGGTWLFWMAWTREEEEEVVVVGAREGRELIARR
jgi:hypothetical protein